MGSVDCLKDIANSLDVFFKGLSDCGLLETYNLQFSEKNMLDITSKLKFKVVVNEFLSNLQKSLQNSLVEEELIISKDDLENFDCMFIEETNEDEALSFNENETVFILPNDLDFIPQSTDVIENDTSISTNTCDENTTDESVFDNASIKSSEPLEHVVRLICSKKDENDISEPWQVSILQNQEVFTTIDTITEVMTKNHMKDEGWRCDMCNKVFPKVQLLRDHCREEHDGKGCFECNLCGTRVMTKSSLKRHIRAHSGIRTNTCSICHKRFKRADYLTTHYKLHEGVRAYKCSICSKEFTSKTGLQLHERVHSDQKDYICHQCNKSFTRRDKLRDHVLRHLNIKRYQCSTCNKRYAEKRDLRSHLKVHDQSAFL